MPEYAKVRLPDGREGVLGCLVCQFGVKSRVNVGDDLLTTI